MAEILTSLVSLTLSVHVKNKIYQPGITVRNTGSPLESVGRVFDYFARRVVDESRDRRVQAVSRRVRGSRHDSGGETRAQR